MFGVLAFALVAGIMFGVAEGASVATLLPTTFGGAYVTGNLDFYYMFEQSICLQNQGSFSTAFPNRGSSSITLVPYSNDVTPAWTCPTATKGPNTFVNSRNGIKLSDATGSSSKSSCVATSSAIGSTIANSMISNGFSIELWYHNFDTSVTEYTESDHVLFEIANASYSGPAQCGLHYSVRLAYSSASQQVVLRVDDDQNPGGCPLPITAVLSNADFQGLHHLAITYLATGPSSGTRTVNFYHDGVSIGSSVASTNATADINSAYSLILGCSTDSIKAEAEGEFNAFALHSTALSPGNISTNFEAFLPNSHPVVADVEIDHLEDDSTDINFTNMYYDFDEEQGKDSEQSITLIVSSLPPRGVLSDDITVTVEVADLPDYAATGTLHYNQTIQNEFTGTDQFDFKIRDGGVGFGISDTASITLNFQPTNDAPVAIADNYTVPVTKEIEIFAVGVDPLDAADDVTLHEPLTVTFLSTSTSNFGQYRRLNGTECDGGEIISLPLVLPVVNSSNGVFGASICYEAFLPLENETDPVDGIVGQDTVIHLLTDGSGSNSSEAESRIAVAGLLSVGCDEFGTLSCVEVMDEDTELIIELKGTDSLCENKVSPPPECPRTKNFIIYDLPQDGQILANISGNLTVLDEFHVNNGDGFLLEDPFVKFIPNKDYFNMAIYKSCRDFGGGTNVGISECADRNQVGGTNFTHNPCTPSLDSSYTLCLSNPAYTTSSLDHGSGRTALGSCGAGLEEGCPVVISYRLNVNGSLSSAALAEDIPGTIVWVRNVENDLASIVGSADNLYSGFEVNAAPKVIGTGAGEVPIQVEHQTQDTAVIDLIITSTDPEFIELSLTDNATASIQDDFEGKDFGITSDCILTVCNGTFEVRGIASKLNFILENLQFAYTGEVDGSGTEKVALFVLLLDPYSTNKGGTRIEAQFNIEIGSPDGDENCGILCDLKFIAIVSALGIFILASCLSYCQVAGHFCYREAMAVEEIVGAGQKSHDTNMHQLEHAVEHLVIAESNRQKCAARLLLWLSCLLPCCCKLSERQKKKLTGITHQTGEGGGGHTYFIDLAERTLYLAAMGRIPAGSLQSESGYVTCSGEEIFDWKPIHYVDKDTGEDKTFYYDPKTDQSQWHNPQGIDVPHSFRAHPPPRV
uniref:WW domain-containing protein n=1 Tax=Aplanochytrium stocchinoi TaxID=215587 RepID=A0A6S8E4H0_9STRA